MTTYLYRAVATETVEPEFEWDYGIEPGFVLGRRATGYLSRSSAVSAGQGSGVAFAIERSNPITFGAAHLTSEQRKLARQARIGAALAEVVAQGDDEGLAKRLAQQILAA